MGVSSMDQLKLAVDPKNGRVLAVSFTDGTGDTPLHVSVELRTNKIEIQGGNGIIELTQTVVNAMAAMQRVAALPVGKRDSNNIINTFLGVST